MKITEIIKSLLENDLLVSEARELVVEFATDIIRTMAKINPNNADQELIGIDSLINFLESFINKAIKEFANDNSPDAEFIRNDGVNLLKHVKSQRNLL